MKYSNAELRGLAGRATPIAERWLGSVIPIGIEPQQVERRIEQWKKSLSIEGDPGILARRLAIDGLDLKACPRWLGSVQLADDQPLPVWAERINGLLERCGLLEEYDTSVRSLEASNADTPTAARDRPLADEDIWSSATAHSDQPPPFWDVWVPFVTTATAELKCRAGASIGLLSADALRSFQQRLLGTLAHLASLPLGLEFRLFISLNYPLSVITRPTLASSPASRDLYRRFVAQLLDGGLLAFFHEYVVLIRLMGEVVEHWIGHVAEFCRRLDEDRPALAEKFNQGQDVGFVAQVQLGLSDPHNGGRTVIIPTFVSGLTVVYKPKDLGIDEAMGVFIEWLNQRGAPQLLSLRALNVLNRKTHGWVEFVEHLTCHDTSDVERYYRRIGMLLCLTYVLGGTDYHLENIIASGEHPVLVDLEMMLQASPRPWDERQIQSADQRATEIIHNSVLRTGLLPIWIMSKLGKSVDMSGIGAEDPQDTGYLRPDWDDINTDRMRMVYRSPPVAPETNRPMLNRQVASARDHISEITDGFSEMYRLLLAVRDEMLSDNGPISKFRGLELRCVLRGTQAYAHLSRRLLHPEFLRDAADRSIEMERLSQPFVDVPSDPDDPTRWGIYQAEIEALERLDIPFFSFVSDELSMSADRRQVAPRFFMTSGWDDAVSRFRRLNDGDLNVQTCFIRACLHARFIARPSDSNQSPCDTSADRQADSSGLPNGVESMEKSNCAELSLDRNATIAAAAAIANQIRAAAILGADGGATWFSLSFDPASERTNLLPMSDNLYDGRAGVALFLAAMEHVTGGPEYRDLALAAMLPLRKALQEPISPNSGLSTLGGAVGLGSQLYALVRIAVWLGDVELLCCASKIADWFTPQRIARDNALDIIGGVAGGILGLLALSDTGSKGHALEAAVKCGDHLLEKRNTTDTGHRAWQISWTSRPLTGFSHGAAGIAYALLRLSQATGEARFRDAAEEGIAYETAVYSATAKNWPDFRDHALSQQGDQFMVAWCHGAPGIGLARLGGLPEFDTRVVRQDIANAVETTLAAPDRGLDHICCGNLGRVDFLVECSRRLSRPDLLDEARRRASQIVRRAERTGTYRLHAHVQGMTDSPSLFQGTAGIGYELLRLAEPDRVPSVLLWQ